MGEDDVWSIFRICVSIVNNKVTSKIWECQGYTYYEIHPIEIKINCCGIDITSALVQWAQQSVCTELTTVNRQVVLGTMEESLTSSEQTSQTHKHKRKYQITFLRYASHFTIIIMLS